MNSMNVLRSQSIQQATGDIKYLRQPSVWLRCGLLILGCALLSSCTARVGAAPIEFQHLTAPSAQAVVVFENGSRETMDSWQQVIDSVKNDLTTYAYNRPGYGESAEPTTSRDGHTIVQELRQNLQARGFKPPYVLVGHSMGGLYMQLFARLYPQEVRGLVLVDSLYPGVIKKPEEFPLTTRIAKSLFVSRAMAQEIDQIHQTGEQVLSLPSPDQIPMVRLVNVPKSAGAIEVDLGVVNKDAATIAQVRSMYPKAHVVICDSDHRIQEANPEFVVAAIREVLAAK